MSTKSKNHCHFCGKLFNAKRTDNNFCSNSHKVSFHRDRKGRITLITSTKEDKNALINLFIENKRKIVREPKGVFKGHTRFYIDFDYYEQITGVKLTDSQKQNRGANLVNKGAEWVEKIKTLQPHFNSKGPLPVDVLDKCKAVPEQVAKSKGKKVTSKV